MKDAMDIIPDGMLRLGFGCGDIYGGRARASSVRVIETALDHGIRYFDTARLYGFGKAEGVLGSVIPKWRDDILLTTKVGISPANRTVRARAYNKLLGLASRVAPTLTRLAPKPYLLDPRYRMFSIADMNRSLETSLRELRTDYVDFLLLHEISADETESEDVQRFAEDAVASGKARFVGTAADVVETREILSRGRTRFPVVQVASSGLDSGALSYSELVGRLTLTHSVLRKLGTLLKALETTASYRNAWVELTGIDHHNRNDVAQLLLTDAITKNSSGIVLFSSSKPENVVASIQAAKNIADFRDRLNGYRTFLRDYSTTSVS